MNWINHFVGRVPERFRSRLCQVALPWRRNEAAIDALLPPGMFLLDPMLVRHFAIARHGPDRTGRAWAKGTSTAELPGDLY